MKLLEEELSYKLTYKDIIDIMKIIDDASCRELQIELEDLKLKIVKAGPGNPAQATTAAPAPPPPANPPAARPIDQTARPAKEGGGGDVKSAAPESASKTTDAAGEEEIIGVPIRSPLAGTFYCAPQPGAKPFVEKGAMVEKGQQVGIVEVMKLMNSIKAPEKGVLKEIRVKNEQSVAMGQVLMTIDPS